MLVSISLLVVVVIVIVAIVRFMRELPGQLNCLQHIEQAHPETTVFALDLHGVIFRQKKGALFKCFFRYIRNHGCWFFFNPIFWHILHTMFVRGSLIEYQYDELAKRYVQLKQLKPYLIEILSEQTFDKDILSMLYKLNVQQYHVYVLSNIWKESLIRLRKKFPELDSLVIDYFIPLKEIDLGKPNPEFFKKFEAFIREREGDKKIIFIDNQQDNIVGAQRAGILSCSSRYLFLLKNSIP